MLTIHSFHCLFINCLYFAFQLLQFEKILIKKLTLVKFINFVICRSLEIFWFYFFFKFNLLILELFKIFKESVNSNATLIMVLTQKITKSTYLRLKNDHVIINTTWPVYPIASYKISCKFTRIYKGRKNYFMINFIFKYSKKKKMNEGMLISNSC